MSQPSDREARLREVRWRIDNCLETAENCLAHAQPNPCDECSDETEWLLAEVDRLERALREAQKVVDAALAFKRKPHQDGSTLHSLAFAIADYEEWAALEGREP